MRVSIFSMLGRGALEHAVRTAVVAGAALAIARWLGMAQAQWAAISAMVVTQSTLGAALKISGQRFAGTVLGALAGALLAAYAGSSIWIFAAGVLGLGVLCAAVRLDRAAYRFAGITLAIVLPVAHAEPAWVVAAHRFIEVSLGIAAGLAMTALWPERSKA
jgi:uncharacterized membrane protein YccC